MSRIMRRLSFIFAVGLACGLPVGLIVGALAGWQLGGNTAVSSKVATGMLPPEMLQDLRLKAAGAHGAATFSMATGDIDEQVEGLYCLDFITGDLQCYVMQTNKAAAGAFKTNVFGDLPPEKGKAPAYVMVTGAYQIQGFAGNSRPAGSLVYVADANTGKVVAYSVTWNRAMAANGAAQAGTLTKVFATNARAAELRE